MIPSFNQQSLVKSLKNGCVASGKDSLDRVPHCPPKPAAYWLCDVGQITSHPNASFSLSEIKIPTSGCCLKQMF